jgi:RNA polymerase sigma-70 factor (ECF subfamily)
MDRNRDLFWELLEPEHLRVRAFCRKLAGNREDGDDLCQEALVRAFTGFASLREPDRFKAWLYRIVVNRYRNRFRRPLWQRLVPLASDSGRHAAGADPAGNYSQRRLLARAFRAVSPADRALITLFETEGWTQAELARMLGKTEASVKVQLCRIRKKMRDALTRYLARGESPRQVATVTKEDAYALSRSRTSLD